MSPEERRHTLCHALRTADCNYNIDGKPVTQLAADDLERLTEELRITNKALSMCSDECNKLYEKYDKKLDELERLTTLKQSDAEPQGVRALEAKCYAEGFADGKKATLAQSNAEPVAWQYRWKMKLFDGGIEWSPWHDLPHGCVERYAELPDYETRALYTAPPRPDASAKDVATKIASRPALAKLIDTGALQFSEMCDLRDDIEKALRSCPDASAGLIEAASSVCFHYLCCDGECNEARPSLLHLAALIGFESDPITNEEIQTARAADRSGKP